jgi:HAD superfamily hydrolase (TIGR01490 family)
MNQPKLALFDLDRTLVRKDTAGLFMKYEYQLGMTSTCRLLKVTWWRLQYTLGFLSAESVAERVLQWFRGRSERDLRAHINHWFLQKVLPHISPKAITRVHQHLQAGDLVVMVTAATRFASERVAQHFGIQHIVCTDLHVADGKLTGEAYFPLCFGTGKVECIQRFLAEQGIKDLQHAVFYTDSITDLPLLEAAQQQVIINPDPRLKRIAKKRGWPIEYW